MNDDLVSLLAYDRWATVRLADAVRRVPEAQYAAGAGEGWSSLRAVVVHVAVSTEAWRRRLAGEHVASLPGIDAMPKFDGAERLWLQANAGLAAWVASQSAARLASPFTYTNTRGITRTLPTWAVVRHVVNHGTHHRGQAASMLRRLGHVPPELDLVVWAAAGGPSA